MARLDKPPPADREQQGLTQAPDKCNDTDNTLKELGRVDISDLHDAKIQMQRRDKASDFARQQREDATLKIFWHRAEQVSTEFRVINDLLYKRLKPDATSMEDFALVVPTNFRRDLLMVSHDTMAAGHLGISKTNERLRNYFFGLE